MSTIVFIQPSLLCTANNKLSGMVCLDQKYNIIHIITNTDAGIVFAYLKELDFITLESPNLIIVPFYQN